MNFKKITASALLLAGIAVSPHALAAQSFDGHKVNVAFEIWNSDDALLGDDVLRYIGHKKDVLASDSVYPDEKDFYALAGLRDAYDWDIDFNQNRIELTYTSINSSIPAHEYKYTWPAGFHFQDIENSLPDIINVIVDADFAPVGFNPDLVTFDADNIYVNLNGSACLKEGGTGAIRDERPMPLCANPMSPTGFNNRIKLTVEFADEATLNQLYDWLESKYPEYLPTHQDSFYIQGYYARYYQGTDVYIGSLGGSLYAYGAQFGGLLDLGELSQWVEKMQKETELVTGNK